MTLRKTEQKTKCLRVSNTKTRRLTIITYNCVNFDDGNDEGGGRDNGDDDDFFDDVDRKSYICNCMTCNEFSYISQTGGVIHE